MAGKRKKEVEAAYDADALVGKVVAYSELGVSPRAFDRYIAKGMPVVQRPGKGRRTWIFSRSACAEWIKKNKGRRSDGKPNGGAPPMSAAEQRQNELFDVQLRKQRADMLTAETKAAQTLGLLIDIDTAVKGFCDRVAEFRTRLQSIPNEVAAEIARETDPREVQQILVRAIDEALADLSSYETPEKATAELRETA